MNRLHSPAGERPRSTLPVTPLPVFQLPRRGRRMEG